MNDADIASSYITKFAKLIRLILDNSRSTEVTLAQELNALHLYVEMEAMRFSNRFECKINIDSNLDV
jgi:LytS/YehU family sensor histidine kinase